MWCLGTWFSGGLDSVRLTVGLNNLKVSFPTLMILRFCCGLSPAGN